MKLSIEIDTDNEAFSIDTEAELARILQEYARRLNLEDIPGKTRLRDANGNTVGYASYEAT